MYILYYNAYSGIKIKYVIFTRIIIIYATVRATYYWNFSDMIPFDTRELFHQMFVVHRMSFLLDV